MVLGMKKSESVVKVLRKRRVIEKRIENFRRLESVLIDEHTSNAGGEGEVRFILKERGNTSEDEITKSEILKVERKIREGFHVSDNVISRGENRVVNRSIRRSVVVLLLGVLLLRVLLLRVLLRLNRVNVL